MQCRSLRESSWHPWSVYLSSTILVAAWVGGAAYFKAMDSMADKKSHWDIWSWSCHQRNKRIITHHGRIPFNTLCIENVSCHRFSPAICANVRCSVPDVHICYGCCSSADRNNQHRSVHSITARREDEEHFRRLWMDQKGLSAILAHNQGHN
jgi:hypothetical protein